MTYLDDNPIISYLIFCIELGIRNEDNEYSREMTDIFVTLMNNKTL